MIGVSTCPVEFEEPDLKARIPACTEVIAAALMCGFRLVPPPNVSHEDVLVGDPLDRLQKAREMREQDLRRLVRFHFLAAERVVEGEKLTVLQFVRKWTEDAALRRTLRADARFDRWHDKLRGLLSENRRAILAVDGNRSAYGKINGNRETLAAFARMMEG